MADERSLQGLPGRGPRRPQEFRGHGLERRRDQDRARHLHRHHPAALRDRRRRATSSSSSARATTSASPPRSIEAISDQRPQGSPLQDPREGVPLRPGEAATSSCSAPAARSPAASTTAPAPSSRPSRRASSTARCPSWPTSATSRPRSSSASSARTWARSSTSRTAAGHRPRRSRRASSGIVIGHGTDTMHHTAAILSFMVQNSPVPDRHGRLAALLATGPPPTPPSTSCTASRPRPRATSPRSWSACSGRPRTTYGLLHRGTRVRKMHSQLPLTFRTIGDIPLAMVSREKITPLRQDYKRRRSDRDVDDQHRLRGEGRASSTTTRT